jgi:hypothetical protein
LPAKIKAPLQCGGIVTRQEFFVPKIPPFSSWAASRIKKNAIRALCSQLENVEVQQSETFTRSFDLTPPARGFAPPVHDLAKMPCIFTDL